MEAQGKSSLPPSTDNFVHEGRIAIKRNYEAMTTAKTKRLYSAEGNFLRCRPEKHCEKNMKNQTKSSRK